jgi:hypothetical protein
MMRLFFIMSIMTATQWMATGCSDLRERLRPSESSSENANKKSLEEAYAQPNQEEYDPSVFSAALPKNVCFDVVFAVKSAADPSIDDSLAIPLCIEMALPLPEDSGCDGESRAWGCDLEAEIRVKVHTDKYEFFTFMTYQFSSAIYKTSTPHRWLFTNALDIKTNWTLRLNTLIAHYLDQLETPLTTVVLSNAQAPHVEVQTDEPEELPVQRPKTWTKKDGDFGLRGGGVAVAYDNDGNEYELEVTYANATALLE